MHTHSSQPRARRRVGACLTIGLVVSGASVGAAEAVRTASGGTTGDCAPVEPSPSGLSDQLFGPGGEPGVGASEVVATDEERSAAAALLEGQKVAISQHIGNSDYTQQVSNAAAAVFEQLGAEVIVSDANFDAAKQVSDIENLLSQDPVALVMFPVDQSASVPGIQAANEAGVPVVVVGSALQDGGEVASLVTADNYEAGVIAASLLRQAVGDAGGAVAALPVKVSLWHMEERARGFAAGLECSGFEIVEDRQACAGPDDCGPVFADVLTAHPDLVGAFGGWDGQALAMNAAAITAGWEGTITTVDLSKATAQSIVDGGEPLVGAAVQQTDEQGETAGNLVVKILAGSEVPSVVFSQVLPGTQETAAALYEDLFGEPLE